MFETIAYRFTNCPLTIDDVIIYKLYFRKRRQIVFEGKVWILNYKNGGWSDYSEDFEASITDKRITKQGIWVKIRVGDYKGEGNLLEVLN